MSHSVLSLHIFIVGVRRRVTASSTQIYIYNTSPMWELNKKTSFMSGSTVSGILQFSSYVNLLAGMRWPHKEFHLEHIQPDSIGYSKHRGCAQSYR